MKAAAGSEARVATLSAETPAYGQAPPTGGDAAAQEAGSSDADAPVGTERDPFSAESLAAAEAAATTAAGGIEGGVLEVLAQALNVVSPQEFLALWALRTYLTSVKYQP